MNISITEKSPEIIVIAMEGRMDAGNAGEFDAAFGPVLEQGPKELIIDLDKLEYISSAGLRSVLTLIKGAKASGGRLKFCGMRPMVADVFKISGFNTMLSIYDSLEAALAAKD